MDDAGNLQDHERPTKTGTYFGLTVFALFVGLAIYRVVSPHTLSQDAEDAMKAAWDGDGVRFSKCILPGETEALSWNSGKLNLYLQNFLTPTFQRTRGYEKQGEYLRSDNEGEAPTSGYFSVNFILPSGKKAEYDCCAIATDQGGKVSAIDFIKIAWRLQFDLAHPGHKDDLSQQYLSYLQGCKRDRTDLENLGVKGLYDNSLDRIVYWSEYESILQARLKKAGATSAPSK